VLHQTRGIVLKTTRFRESSAIVNIYTEKLGLQTYIVNSIFSKKAKNKAAYLQPLSLLQLVVYFRENQNIKRIKEMQWALIFQQIPFHPVKRALAVFINEILNKAIREEEANPNKFQFLYDQIVWLDTTDARLKQLGFAPLNNRTDALPFFSLQQGQFVEGHILNRYQLNPIDSALLQNQRKDLLELFVQYYKIHIESFGKLKSLQVFEQLF